jgi:peptidoglycan/LPS O-acetylase OafA/YrhL
MEPKNTGRFLKLDGLRGLLSLIVCLNHSFLVIVIPTFANVWAQNPLIFHNMQAKLQQLFMLIGNGGAAVTLFFLLSGLVLGQSLSKVKMNPRGLLGFIIKRLIRLYPVYIFLLIATTIYMKSGFVYQTFPFSSAWFNWWMHFQMTLKEFILNFFFIHIYIGGVTWTLRVIIIASFLFPLFYLLNKKTSWWLDLLISVALIYLSFTVLNLPGFRDFRYLYMFYLGLIIPKFRTFFSGFPNWLVCLLLPFAICLMLGFRYLINNEYQGGVVEALISFFIIGLSAYGSKAHVLNFLENKFFKFYGKISYSLYLIHFSILYIVSKLMFNYLPNLPYSDHYFLIHFSLFFFTTAIATGVSYLVYRYIEMPSHQLSIQVGKKLSEE